MGFANIRIPLHVAQQLHQWLQLQQLQQLQSQCNTPKEDVPAVCFAHMSQHSDTRKIKVLHCITLHCIAVHCIAFHCIVVASNALYCIVLHCIALYCGVLWLKTLRTACAQLSHSCATVWLPLRCDGCRNSRFLCHRARHGGE